MENYENRTVECFFCEKKVPIKELEMISTGTGEELNVCCECFTKHSGYYPDR